MREIEQGRLQLRIGELVDHVAGDPLTEFHHPW